MNKRIWRQFYGEFDKEVLGILLKHCGIPNHMYVGDRTTCFGVHVTCMGLHNRFSFTCNTCFGWGSLFGHRQYVFGLGIIVSRNTCLSTRDMRLGTKTTGVSWKSLPFQKLKICMPSPSKALSVSNNLPICLVGAPVFCIFFLWFVFLHTIPMLLYFMAPMNVFCIFPF